MSRLRIAVILGLWLLLIGVGLGLAPAGDGQDGERVMAFFALDGEPLTVAIFNALGVWPMLYGAVLLRDPRQRVPPWISVLLSFVVGGFALLPGLALRRWDAGARAHPSLVRRLITGPLSGVVLLLATVGLTGFAATGSVSDYARLAGQSSLVFTMSVDFLALCAAWPILLLDDARRHRGPAWRVALGLLPLLGPSLWLIVRGSRVSVEDAVGA